MAKFQATNCFFLPTKILKALLCCHLTLTDLRVEAEYKKKMKNLSPLFNCKRLDSHRFIFKIFCFFLNSQIKQSTEKNHINDVKQIFLCAVHASKKQAALGMKMTTTTSRSHFSYFYLSFIHVTCFFHWMPFLMPKRWLKNDLFTHFVLLLLPLMLSHRLANDYIKGGKVNVQG